MSKWTLWQDAAVSCEWHVVMRHCQRVLWLWEGIIIVTSSSSLSLQRGTVETMLQDTCYGAHRLQGVNVSVTAIKKFTQITLHTKSRSAR